MFDYEAERETAMAAVGRAAQLCVAVQSEVAGGVLHKQDRSPVTIADFGSQAVICKLLLDRFPQDPVIAEESSVGLRQGPGAELLPQVVDQVAKIISGCSTDNVCAWIDRGDSTDHCERFWTLDPIDGTKGFLRGDQFAISLALVVDGKVVVAAVACPKLWPADSGDGERGAIFSAVKDRGAVQQRVADTQSMDRIQVSAEASPVNIRFCESVEQAHSSHGDSARIAAFLGIEAAPVRLDSQAKYAVVARGDAEAYLRLPKSAQYREKIWDHAGGALVVTEAGGRVTDIHGKQLDFTCGRKLERNRGVIVSNNHVHDSLLEAISELKIGC